MGQVTRAAPHLSVEQIEEKIELSKDFRSKRRWMIIRHALVAPAKASEIGLHLGLAAQTVHNLVSAYNRQGPQVLDRVKKSHRRHAYLTVEQESEFLEPFVEKAKAGQLTTATEIAAALEERLGHRINRSSTIYRLLDRHEWSKKVPRPAHVKSQKEEQEEFKKLSTKGRAASARALFENDNSTWPHLDHLIWPHPPMGLGRF